MIALNLKDGVKLTALQPQMVLVVLVALGVYEKLGARKLTITSGNDGEHMKKSSHWTGMALDLRIWTLPAHNREKAAEQIKAATGDNFDVVFKSNHIHIEYDPVG